MNSEEYIINALSDRQFQSGCVNLHNGPNPESEPVIEGQIKTPTEQSIRDFKVMYAPYLDSVCTPGKPLRVLEIGAGIGNCTYGFIKTYCPDLYVASEPFPSLVPILRKRLDEWGYSFPKGIAATYDANYQSVLPKETFTVVIGNSVLHHIVNWRDALDFSLTLLEKRGVLVFGEPNHEVWAVIVSFVRALNLSDTLSIETKTRLEAFVKGLEYRFRMKDNQVILAKLEDKHIFSFRELTEFAQSRNLVLSFTSRQSSFREIFLNKVRPLMTTLADREHLDFFAKKVVSSGLDGTMLSDAFIVFAMHRLHDIESLPPVSGLRVSSIE